MKVRELVYLAIGAAIVFSVTAALGILIVDFLLSGNRTWFSDFLVFTVSIIVVIVTAGIVSSLYNGKDDDK